MASINNNPQRRCLSGYGGIKNCPNQAIEDHYWCERCEVLRRDHISARFAEIKKRMAELAEAGKSEVQK